MLNSADNSQKDRHVFEYLTVMLTELTHREVLNATALVHRDDFGDNWQGLTVFDALEEVARAGIDDGHPDQPLALTDVNAHLLEAGKLKNEAFRAYWNTLVSPPEGHAHPLGKYRLRELARRIPEDHFREVHAEVYGRDDSHVVPLAEMVAQMDTDRKKLLAIYARIKPAPAVALVREGGAA